MLVRLFRNNIKRQSTTYCARLNSSSSKTSNGSANQLSLNAYHEASDIALEELSERLEMVLEDRFDKGADVSLSSGVLTVTIDDNNTYVINKQTPNKQIWLSSPISGPMRFEFDSGKWIEKRSKTELRKLLSTEMSDILKKQVDC